MLEYYYYVVREIDMEKNIDREKNEIMRERLSKLTVG
jgi:hypothetical protein